ncbi:hypothetical protein K502DRAFT_300293 [Neoconidiobolus thromboides FSU 785]|nr:hypothetical protein K502DRAFT_300293 [Neoconidiobolus thromboides FSU 785]
MEFIQHQQKESYREMDSMSMEEIIDYVQERSQYGEYNFNLNSNILLSFNNNGQYMDNDSNDYFNIYYKNLNLEIQLPPSVYKMLANAYFCLRRLGEDQNLYFSGTDSPLLIEHYFMSIEQSINLINNSKNKEMSQSLLNFKQFYQCLDFNKDVILLQQLQLNNKGKFNGMVNLLLNYQIKEEVYYWILFGFEKELNNIKGDLNNLNELSSSHDNKVHFHHFKEALINLGFENEWEKIMEMISISYYFKNLNIQQDNDGVQLIENSLLQHLAILLNINIEDLIQFIIKKDINNTKQNYSIYLNQSQIYYRLLLLSRSIITQLFDQLIFKLNQKWICKKEYSNHLNYLLINNTSNYNNNEIELLFNEFNMLKYIQYFHQNHSIIENESDLYFNIIQIINELSLSSEEYLVKNKNKNKENKLMIKLSQKLGNELIISNHNQFMLNNYLGKNIEYETKDFIQQNQLNEDLLQLIQLSNNNLYIKNKNYTNKNMSLFQARIEKSNIKSERYCQGFINLLEALNNNQTWYHFHFDYNLNNNNNEIHNIFQNINLIQSQSNKFKIQFLNEEFNTRYQSILPNNDLSQFNLHLNMDYIINDKYINLSLSTFYLLESQLKNNINNNNSIANTADYNVNYTNKSTPFPLIQEKDISRQNLIEKENEKVVEKQVKVEELTFARKAWLRVTWLMTWWIPTCCIRRRMDRPDVQMAWREKVAICVLIVWSWIVILFVNIGLGLILCPPDKVWLPEEIKTLQGPDDLGVYMYGVVYDITNFAQQRHGKSINPAGVDPDTMYQFGGQDVTSSFPVPLYIACPDYVTDSGFKLWTNTSDDTLTSQYFVHDSGPLTQYPATSLKDPNWFYSKALPQLKNLKKGEVAFDFKTLSDYRKAGYKQWGAINNKVYDLTPYIQTINEPQFQTQVPGAPKADFLPNTIAQIFNNDSPAKDADLTTLFNTKSGLSDSEKKKVMSCLDRAFYVGKLDPRSSVRCQLTNILLLVSSGIILLVTLVKFLAALQLSSKREPMDYDKFVICQVPCYTEGEDSIRRTLESLALLNYDDKHKLIFVIADGMIIGSGNDKPTPKIVVDVLGVDPSLDPEPFCYKAIGDGSKQLNYAKVYSGLYMVEGRSVPYIVVAKVGKPSERNRPGNRGKRDSQILLMNFLNRVHFDAPMTPLDLEIYHQLKNVIGVDPSLYEYVLMVDADTEVMQDSLTRLIAVMTRDAKVIGLCGETCLSNENQSITTMMQVYEYYISHNLAKAFESLFGAVTCLPGCFCMYRIKTGRNQPLIISNQVIKDYSENIVDTLHKKNLLHLGEDRYLTTLMLKHFPTYKMKYTPDAQCKTVAPERFEVLLSQRRRWINSTIHNLFELVFLNEMCGFCCFSMRFVVFLDLVGTLILPATVIYLIYIIVAAATGFQYISTYSIIIMCSAYILQALIFIIKQQWQHIGWMVFYLLGMGLFNFYIPIYSFWHFDDFSWGNTRVVLGDDGKKQIINEEEETFDPNSIPYIKWSEHEQLIWENQTVYSNQLPIPQHFPHDQFIRDSTISLSQPPPLNQNIHYPQNDMFTRDSTISFQHQMQARESQLYHHEQQLPYSPYPMSTLGYNSNTINTNNEANVEDYLYNELVVILDSVDLMKVSKKQIREILQNKNPQLDLTNMKEFISNAIDAIIEDRRVGG